MARARNIKPGILKNELLGTADPLLTILFEGLWMLADREGRLEDRPLRIKAEVFPYRDSVDVDAQLAWLSEHKFIERYEANGHKCLSINKFLNHQRPHHNEPPSELPPKNGSKRCAPKVKGLSNLVQSTSTNGRRASTNGTSTSLLLIDTLLIESPSPLPFHSEGFLEALRRWAKHRTEIRKPLTSTSIRTQLSQMADWGEARSIAAIDHSIAKGWQGLFEAGRSDKPSKPPAASGDEILRRIEERNAANRGGA